MNLSDLKGVQATTKRRIDEILSGSHGTLRASPTETEVPSAACRENAMLTSRVKDYLQSFLLCYKEQISPFEKQESFSRSLR
jgi:hypothetical protein